ncbi:MAG TPA: hypothetical protein DSN98_08405 [Thermoplasmata archaeon]|nr:MAG TPA: hypothetical protein DSN98_08405 [Thermoplasmata archaeon]
MPLGKAIILAAILVVSSFSGCMFLRQTKFTLISLTVDDDGGFPQMYLQFNVSDISTLTLIGPQKTALFSDTYYMGVHNESISLAGYRTANAAGMYTLKATDASKNTIYENELQFNGHDLSLSSLSEEKWTGDAGLSVIVFHLEVTNSGDLPAYPFNLTVLQGENQMHAFLLPTVVLPGHTEQIPCFIPLVGLPSEGNQLNISLYDNSGVVLLSSSVIMMKKSQMASWEYHWTYLGDHTLKAPEVDWFYDYYKSVERYDITDYAAYVFDRYDDLYR